MQEETLYLPKRVVGVWENLLPFIGSKTVPPSEQIAFVWISWDTADMKIKSKVYAVAAVLLLGALVFLGVTWWVNGRDDTWLYAVCALIVLTSFIPLLSGKDGKNQ